MKQNPDIYLLYEYMDKLSYCQQSACVVQR